jgi:hypothetical protein
MSLVPNATFAAPGQQFYSTYGSGGGGGGGGGSPTTPLEASTLTLNSANGLVTAESVVQNNGAVQTLVTISGGTAVVASQLTGLGSPVVTDYRTTVQNLYVFPNSTNATAGSGLTGDGILVISNNVSPGLATAYSLTVPSAAEGADPAGSLVLKGINGGTTTELLRSTGASGPIVISAPTTTAGTLGVGTNLTVGGTLNVTGLTTLAATTMSGTLTANGAANFTGAVNFSGAVTGISGETVPPVLQTVATAINAPDIQYNETSLVATITAPNPAYVFNVEFLIRGATWVLPSQTGTVNAYFFLGPPGQTALGPQAPNALNLAVLPVNNGASAAVLNSYALTYYSSTPITSVCLYAYNAGVGNASQADVNLSVGGTIYVNTSF